MRVTTRVTYGVAALCVCGLACSQDSGANVPYMSLLPGYVFGDREIDPSGHGMSITALVGRPLSTHFAAEINVSGAILETGQSGGTDFYQQSLAGDLVLNLAGERSNSLRPFFLLGVGAIHDDFYPDDRDGSGLLAEAALGLASGAWLAERVAFRAEVRHVHDFREGGSGQTRAAIGIEIALGRTERRVEYVDRIVETEVVREVERRWVDTDGDGVEEARDRCPDTPKGLKVDATGCAIVNQAIELRGVTFEFGKARLTPNAETVLDAVSRAFAGQATLRVEIAGHTDSIGSDAANQILSQRRAEAVRTYLIFKGAQESQLTARGYGEGQLLIDPEKSDEDRERNRRVELRVMDGG